MQPLKDNMKPRPGRPRLGRHVRGPRHPLRRQRTVWSMKEAPPPLGSTQRSGYWLMRVFGKGGGISVEWSWCCWPARSRSREVRTRRHWGRRTIHVVSLVPPTIFQSSAPFTRSASSTLLQALGPHMPFLRPTRVRINRIKSICFIGGRCDERGRLRRGSLVLRPMASPKALFGPRARETSPQPRANHHR